MKKEKRQKLGVILCVIGAFMVYPSFFIFILRPISLLLVIIGAIMVIRKPKYSE